MNQYLTFELVKPDQVVRTVATVHDDERRHGRYVEARAEYEALKEKLS